MISPALHVPKEAIAKLCRESQIRELAIFGSATRADFKPATSDLDILVEFRPEARLGWFRFTGVQEALEALFQRKVDLVSTRGLNKRIREEVLASREIIYAE